MAKSNNGFWLSKDGNTGHGERIKKTQTETEVGRHIKKLEERAVTVRVGLLKTGQGGGTLLQSYLWCPMAVQDC